MKVIINTEYGGLNLSHAAVLRYGQLKGLYIYRTPEKLDEYFFDREMQERWDLDDIEREDPALIQVIEEMGEKAETEFGKFKIIEIPDGVKFWVEEFEPNGETISEQHRWWNKDGLIGIPDPPSRLERLKLLEELMCRGNTDGIFKTPEKLIDNLRDLRDEITTEEQSRERKPDGTGGKI